MALSINQRYRPLSLASPFDPDQDQDGPDYRENPETADFSGGDATGPARQLQAPPDHEPNLKKKSAMDDGAGKVPANTPPRMAGGPIIPGTVNVTPDMLKQPETEADDMPAAPPAMAGGPQKPLSPLEGAKGDLEAYRALKSPEKPKNNVLQTIGQTILGASALGPAGAEAIMHPKYTGQQRDVAQKRADLAGRIKLADDVEKVSLTDESRKANAAYREDLTGNRKTAELDKINSLQQKAQEESLKIIKEGGRIVKAGTPEVKGMNRIADPADYDIRTGQYRGRTFLDVPENYGLVALTPEQAEQTNNFYAPGQLVSRAERESLAQVSAGKYSKKDPSPQENLNHWVATYNSPTSTAEEKELAKKNIDMLRKEQTATHFSFSMANAQNREVKPIVAGSPLWKVARDLSSGDMTYQQFRGMFAYSRDKSERLAVYNLARDLNPNFNPADFEMGYNFAKSPKVKAQVAALNNVHNGMGDLLKFSDQAERSGATILNKFLMPKGIALGGKVYTNFHTARIAYADELAGALGYGNATDMSKDMGLNMTDENYSPENFKAAIEDVIEPFIARKRAAILGQMGPYGAPRGQEQPAGPGRTGGEAKRLPSADTSDAKAKAYLEKNGH